MDFFSSNRPGKGSDDIYRFTETRKINCEQLIAGYVTDQETGDFMGNSQVVLRDANQNILKEMYANELGYYSFAVDCDKKYYVRASKLKYEIKEVTIDVPKLYGTTDMNIELDKKVKIFKRGDDVGPKLGIKTIYFDLDKSSIRADAAVELAKITALMEKYPNIKIDIRSHTDSRQTKKYNQKLSDKRAKATMSWLIKKRNFSKQANCKRVW